MSEAVTIVLDGIPRGKERPRFRQGQRRPFTPKATEDYETSLGWAARRAMMSRAPFSGPVEIELTILLPIPSSWSAARRKAALSGAVPAPKKPDFDNVLKIIGDGFNNIVWDDDAQITDGRWRKRYALMPKVIVTVRPLQAEAAQWAA